MVANIPSNLIEIIHHCYLVFGLTGMYVYSSWKCVHGFVTSQWRIIDPHPVRLRVRLVMAVCTSALISHSCMQVHNNILVQIAQHSLDDAFKSNQLAFTLAAVAKSCKYILMTEDSRVVSSICASRPNWRRTAVAQRGAWACVNSINLARLTNWRVPGTN